MPLFTAKAHKSITITKRCINQIDAPLDHNNNFADTTLLFSLFDPIHGWHHLC